MNKLEQDIAKEVREQEKLDKKMAREERVEECRGNLHNFAEDFYDNTIGRLTTYIRNKKDKFKFQHNAEEVYDNYLDMHDESKIGTIDHQILKNGGFRVIVYSEKGPIIKTVENTDITNTISIDHCNGIDVDFYHARPGRKISYEGYCYWQDFEGENKHYYYANLSRVIEEKVSDENLNKYIEETFTGFERQNDGKFKKVNLKRTSYNPIEIYEDLRTTFETAYRQIKATQELENSRTI